MSYRALVVEILRLLTPARACLHRRYIEDHLYTAFGAQGTEITNVLDQMRSDRQILLTPVKNSGGVSENVYSTTLPDTEVLSVIEGKIHRRNEALDANVLGQAGEIYVRQLLVRTKLFRSIPQRRRLGRSARNPGEPADLIVRYKDASILTLPIVCEVKNTYERFYPGSVIFAQILKKALDQGGLPVLCVAHLCSKALVFCEDLGIGVLHLARQLAPFRLKRKIEAVSDLIGAPLFEYIDLAKPLRPLTHGKARDLLIVSSRDWLKGAAERWECTKTVVSDYHNNLGKKSEWRAVQREIHRRITPIRTQGR